jgi:hypothetical protein
MTDLNNKDKILAYRREYFKVGGACSDLHRYRQFVRRQLRCFLRKMHGVSWKAVSGWVQTATAEDWLQYLFKNFKDRYGYIPTVIDQTIELDHIIPLCTATSREEVDILNHLTNLQLLTKEDNQKKGRNHGNKCLDESL